MGEGNNETDRDESLDPTVLMAHTVPVARDERRWS